MEKDKKRVFLGMEVFAPWPKKLSQGRLLDEKQRHLTLAFIGELPIKTLQELINTFPIPSFKIGFAGQFDNILFLPNHHHPNVIAWHIKWLEDTSALSHYQTTLIKWLQNKDIPLKNDHNFLPHVTISRKPFIREEWRKTFIPLPLFVKNIHLYESLGNSQYQSLWSLPIQSPFEEIDHTADLSFLINGYTLKQVHLHAQIALAFKYPLLLNYFSNLEVFDSLDDVIIELNALITRVDSLIGSPYKAVSFHGELIEQEDKTLQWEMIVDV